MTVSFETKVWEKDWELILKTSRLERLIAQCQHSFEAKILLINNVKDPSKVFKEADRLVKSGVITEYINVADHARDALDYFDLTQESLGLGYYYSIAELVSLYLSKSKYLLHFSGDTVIAEVTPKNWLNMGLKILEIDPKIKVVNLGWDSSDVKMKEEMVSETPDYWRSIGFSDQMYLVRTEDFKAKIYNYHHPFSDRYPKYGGELFEKRIDSWLRVNHFYRATIKNSLYIHRNFTDKPWKKKLSILLDKPDLFS
jgi:hypothetical protein